MKYFLIKWVRVCRNYRSALKSTAMHTINAMQEPKYLGFDALPKFKRGANCLGSAACSDFQGTVEKVN
jgi:hypothetical protein